MLDAVDGRLVSTTSVKCRASCRNRGGNGPEHFDKGCAVLGRIVAFGQALSCTCHSCSDLG